MPRVRHVGPGLALVLALAGCAPAGPAARPPVHVLHRGVHCDPLPALDDGGARRIGATQAGVQVRLSMGRRASGGHAVALRRSRPLAVVAGVARVAITWREPAPGSAVTTVMTRPCLEVSVPHAYRGVDFVDGDGRVRGAVRWSDDG